MNEYKCEPLRVLQADDTPTKTQGPTDDRIGASPEPLVDDLVQSEGASGASGGPAMMDVSLVDNGDFMTAPSTPNTSMTVSVPAQLPVTSVQVRFLILKESDCVIMH